MSEPRGFRGDAPRPAPGFVIEDEVSYDLWGEDVPAIWSILCPPNGEMLVDGTRYAVRERRPALRLYLCFAAPDLETDRVIIDLRRRDGGLRATWSPKRWVVREQTSTHVLAHKEELTAKVRLDREDVAYRLRHERLTASFVKRRRRLVLSTSEGPAFRVGLDQMWPCVLPRAELNEPFWNIEFESVGELSPEAFATGAFFHQHLAAKLRPLGHAKTRRAALDPADERVGASSAAVVEGWVEQLRAAVALADEEGAG